jgi:hypothetical protein
MFRFIIIFYFALVSFFAFFTFPPPLLTDVALFRLRPRDRSIYLLPYALIRSRFYVRCREFWH